MLVEFEKVTKGELYLQLCDKVDKLHLYPNAQGQNTYLDKLACAHFFVK